MRRRSPPVPSGRRPAWSLPGAALLLLGACGDGGAASSGERALLGGDTTVFDDTALAFSNPAGNLKGDRRDAFFFGHSIFKRTWVTAPATTEGMDGLGPLFNSRSCSACHASDGRGAPPEPAEGPFVSMLLRLSLPGADDHGGPRPDGSYGGQLRGHGVLGVPSDGTAQVSYSERPGRYGDGTAYSLRAPSYRIAEPGYGPLPPDLLLSPRAAPHLVGLGLLEAVPEAAILALADEEDRDRDGISGRPNRVWDAARGQLALGRFGWKANQPSLRQQTAGAFLGDMGVTSSLFLEEACTGAQRECAQAARGAPPGQPEIEDRLLDATVFYMHTIGVPARRALDDERARRGEALFAQARCDGCHVAELTTGPAEGLPELAGQRVHPYTDLLLHDMGPELADGRPDYAASGSEWKTPPLWGLGLLPLVNRHQLLLHDGRARGFAEAILWHGGEGAASRDAFAAMSAEDRAALVRFLETL